MENLVTVNPIIWEKGPEGTQFGDVFDRLEDGTPRQWVYQVYNNAHIDEKANWVTRYMDKPYLSSPNESGLGSEQSAKDACFEHKKQLIEKLLSVTTDGGKDKAIGDLRFISEIINDLKNRNLWNHGTKFHDMLNDWRNELMGLGGVEDESEIQAIHAERCGAENWGIEPEEDHEDFFEGDFEIDEEE